MKVGKCPICGGDTKEDIVEVQEIKRMYSLGEMRRIEKVREKIKNRMIEPMEVRRIAVVSL
jgi:hypothetical protein